MIRVTILYDNLLPPLSVIEKNPNLSKVEKHHGFSALVEFDGKKILFDAGWDGAALLNNCKALNVDLKGLDALFISHAHWDHIGGIPAVLHKVKIPQIYLPHGYSNNQIKEIERLIGNPYIQRIKGFQVLEKLSPRIASTGTLKSKEIGEQYLLVKQASNHGVLLVAGCSHPGLKKPMRVSEKKFGPVSVICGGVHEFNEEEVLKDFANRGLKSAHIGHCTKHFDVFESIKEVSLTRIYTGLQFQL